MPRYTLHPCPPIEAELERHFDRVRESADAVGLGGGSGVCLVLGGGYGRGEGSVLDREGVPHLYNDLDYFLFVPAGQRGAAETWRQEVEIRESDALGIDVEIKALSRDDVGDPSESMMMHDLVAGHHVVFGDAAFLAEKAPSLDSSHLPIREATRLLWNRGSGLYFARCRILSEREPEFVERNHAKAKLALGDAFLCAYGRYASSCLERAARLEGLDGDSALNASVRRCHREGIEFKMRPAAPDPEPDWSRLLEENYLLSKLWVQVFLDVESRRLGKPFMTASDYSNFRGRICREVPMWKAPIFAMRDLLRHRRCLRPIWDYPRSALLRALSCLIDPDPSSRADRVGEFLPSPAGASEDSLRTAPGWEGAYSGWWERYS